MVHRWVAAASGAMLLLLATSASAQVVPEPQGDPKIYVLTFGPGDHPFFKFGHNAIWVRSADGPGLVYNFGTFQFDSPALIPKFLRGRMTYWLSVSPAVEALYSYQASNRTIETQELDLTPQQNRDLAASLRENARPENRDYLYDYFWDNCSTRVRDAVDRVVAGQVQAVAREAAPLTFRDHALRLTADMFPVYLGLHAGLGSRTDAPITLWQEAFLPERLRDLLGRVRVVRDGKTIPLVKQERVLFQATRPPPLSAPPGWTIGFGLTGLFFGLGTAFLGNLAERKRAARVLLGLVTAILGLVCGLLGLVLALLWTLTDHKAAYANANIYLCAPWLLALVVLGVGLALGRPLATKKCLWLVRATAVLSLVGVAAKVLPGPAQDNAVFIVLLLPIWVGLAFGIRRVTRAQ